MTFIEAPAAPSRAPWRAWGQVARLHHWVKNLLVLAPLAAAHRLNDGVLLAHASWAFFAFCLCASGIYALNDRIDRLHDREHPDKRSRPVSDGRISPAMASRMALVLLVLGGTLSWLTLSWQVCAVLGAYVVLGVVYSIWLKRIPVVDLFALVAFYLLRLLAGSVAVGIALSGWLMAFALLLFGGLALLKRYSELVLMARGGEARLSSRGYSTRNLEAIWYCGLLLSMAASLILSVYAHSATAQDLYRNPLAFHALALLSLAWHLRAWSLARNGRMHHDPVSFALGDRLTWAGLVLAALVLAWALLS